jgi:hypothetical protein
MVLLKIFICLASLIALYTQAGTMKLDKKETLNGVNLQTGKIDSIRTYQGQLTTTLSFSLETVKKGVVNFTERCNNDYKNKRKYTDKSIECKYHNENIVESFIIRDLKAGWTKDAGEIDRFLIGRQIYNRGSFGYYELVKVSEGVNAKGQKTITIAQQMLDDKEVEQYATPKFEKESAFDKSTGVFTLTQIGTSETEFTFDYSADTDHWVLNKEISVPQVFSSISKSINDLVKTIAVDSNVQSRDVASNHQ